MSKSWSSQPGASGCLLPTSRGCWAHPCFLRETSRVRTVMNRGRHRGRDCCGVDQKSVWVQAATNKRKEGWAVWVKPEGAGCPSFRHRCWAGKWVRGRWPGGQTPAHPRASGHQPGALGAVSSASGKASPSPPCSPALSLLSPLEWTLLNQNQLL